MAFLEWRLVRLGGRLPPGARARACARPGAGHVRPTICSCAVRRRIRRPCRSSSAPARPTRSRLIRTRSPASAPAPPRAVPLEAEPFFEDALSPSSRSTCSTLLGRRARRASLSAASTKGSRRWSRRWRSPVAPASLVALLGWALAAAGRKEEARALLEELRSRPVPSASTIVAEAWLLAALGGDRRRFRGAPASPGGAPAVPLLHGASRI